MWRDSVFDGVEWWRSEELGIPEEIDQLAKDPMSSSSRSVSTSAKEISSLSPSAGAGQCCRDGLLMMPARPMPVLKDTASVAGWLCEYPNCGRSFTHRYRLK